MHRRIGKNFDGAESGINMRIKHIKLFALLLIAGILVSIPLSLLFGSAALDIKSVMAVILYKINPDRFPLASANMETIVWNLRLPRILLAVAVGSGLSLCGVTMQAMTRNVMAEPYTLGVAAGASAMAAVYISWIEGNKESLFGVNAFAFMGAVLAMLLIFSLSAGKRYASSYKLILTGIIIGMIFDAFRQVIISTTHNPNKVNNMVLWTMGGFGAARWENIWPPILVSAIGSVWIFTLAEKLNLLSIGEQTATTLGISLKTLQRSLVLITSFMTGTIVASCGIISFVGLIVPHMARKLVGADHRRVVPISALLGAFLLIWTDVLARTALAPEELPIAVLTSLIGGPLLILLMKKGRGL